MSFIAGAMLDKFGIWSVIVLNLAFMVPSVFLSLHLWRPKGKVDEAQSKGEELGDAAIRLPSVSDLIEMVSPKGAGLHGATVGKRDLEGSGGYNPVLDQQSNFMHRKPTQAEDGSAIGLELQDGGGTGRDIGCKAHIALPASDELPFMVKLRLIFSRPESMVFFFTTIVMGMGFGLIESYLFLMLKDLGASDLLLDESI